MVPKGADNGKSILDRIPETISGAFDQTQLTLANHRKNCVALHKLHQQAASITEDARGGTATRLVGEKAFGDAFVEMVSRVLLVKKGPPAADRVVRFVGAYVMFLNEKALADKAKAQEGDSSNSVSARLNDGADEDTFVSRFVTRLLKWLLRGFIAKSKITRYRCVSIVAEMIAHIGEVDEDLYNLLREGLLDRISDKESLIRVHAVIALSKLVGTEDPDDTESGEPTILEILLDIACHDSAPEVRRAALLNVPLLPATLDTILVRTRDTDVPTRKLIYSNVLLHKLGHPRQLTIAQREQVVKDGLGDREPSVRIAAGKLVGSWFDVVLAEPRPDEEGEGARSWEGDDGGVMKGFVKFLGLFDVVGPGEAVAVDAMLSIFVMRPSVTEAFVFLESYWKTLTPESAVLARVFVEHCINAGLETQLESASLPVMTAFAFHLQEEYNKLVELLQETENVLLLSAGQEPDEEDTARREEELAKQEVVLDQLLRMVLKLDFMDEIGKRKLFSVVRGMVAHPELPPGLINPSMDVLKLINTNERDLIRVVVEIIIDLREQEPDALDDKSVFTNEENGDISRTTISTGKTMQRTKTREMMSPEERMEADVTDLRCLTLCIGMLERVDGTFEDNSTLEGILADLIIPSVKRKELPLRGKGLISLGLCCLIAKNMALSSFQLFLNQVQTSPPDLKLRVLQVIFDLLIMYDQEFFGRSDDIAKKVIDFLLQTLEAEESPALQALICVGLAKLLLAGIVTDSRVLAALILTYVSPSSAGNQELRQCLSYFFPVYCYSLEANQSRMESIFISTFDFFIKLRESLEEEQETILPYQFGLLMVDWTDPQKRSRLDDANPGVNTHADLATNILAALYDSERSGEDQKVFCQLLGHLHIMPGLDSRSIHKLNLLLEHHDKQCSFEDDSVTKIFGKFKDRFTKMFTKELRHIQPGQYLDDDLLQLYNFIGIDPPEPSNDGGDPSAPVLESATPSQSQSLVPCNDGAEDEAASSSGNESGMSSPTPSPRTKATKLEKAPKRACKSIKETVLDEDPGEATDATDAPVAPVSTPKKRGIKRNQLLSPASSPGGRKRTRTSRSHKLRQEKAPPNRKIEDDVEEDEEEENTPKPLDRRRSRIRTELRPEDEDGEGVADMSPDMAQIGSDSGEDE